ncbi:MAG: hypothetical protein H2B05_03175 [Nitrosopumilaceae archaeon]|jgi:hypothetical protein|uniref:Uncharacterized protein n=3 Tax=Candidatus Nitrosomaritimum aestuariumsis TaxID=3342354 RepID=A0AC60W7T0_9ARCH|nr:hypothetical protein [Nitrosopumilaceae archaeon]MBA4453926.1 hypothetical protein [Nitrosopumilaceae archaeon]MBA4460343.1 hypothetical protein [Nitrosopumilaceae archaeon]MBA4461565.1 hypothetical protein [Nitrosopumilaceae archaeon]MBA4463158.1 hypothetical protein [Nitrosopumilaceae archaeon]
MDEKLKIKIEEKIQETISNKNEINQILESLSSVDDSKSFILGIVVGRLYNAFYYQTKRILNREPSKEEFVEFVEYLKNRKSDFENLW